MIVPRGIGAIRRGMGSDISALISQTAASKGVDPAVALAIAQHESGLNPNAQNPGSSAAGLFQLINATQRQYGVTNPYDPAQNAAGGIQFYSDMLKRYGGDQDLALLAYAWGPGNVDKWRAGGSDPAALPSEGSQFVSWIDSHTGVAPSIFSGDAGGSVDDTGTLDTSGFFGSDSSGWMWAGVIGLAIFAAFAME